MSKKKRERRVLIGAMIVAGVITAGSTFAWFTSKDEVTNRLSASASYDVSIAEDFQPPEDWIPGQTINKDVSAVNTGSVDAFVRMWLEGEMSVMNKLPLASSTAVPATVAANLGLNSTSTDEAMYALGFKYYDASKKYYKVLSQTERTNPGLNGSNTNVNDNDYSEVKSVQAGGYLVYAPAGAEWTYTTEQQTEITNSDGDQEIVAKDKVIGSKNVTSGADATLNVEANCPIDSDTFTPITPGLYIFRRNADLGAANTADTYEFSGYVFDGVNYFALCNDTNGKSDYTLPNGAVTFTTTSPQAEPSSYSLVPANIKLYTASETVVENADLTWTYDSATPKLTATYYGAENTAVKADPTAANDTADDIVIDVKLDNIGTTGQKWTAKTADGKTTTFYYTDDVEAGDSTAKLVDSVTLSKDTTQHAFLAFDFDLNVFLESVQVVIDEDGNEKTTPVEAGGQFATAPTNGVGASATAQTAAEIADIAWN